MSAGHLIGYLIPQRQVGSPIALQVLTGAEGRLRRSGNFALRDIGCVDCGGVASLRDCLPTDFLKRIAPEVATEVEDVRKIENRLEIRSPARHEAARPEARNH